MLFSRRVIFAIGVLISQLLLMAVAIAWCIRLVLIARHGGINSVEMNPVVLYGEIAATVLIILFATAMFILQCKRLGEGRRKDDKKEDS